MSRDGPQAGRDELARVFALLPKHSLLHVGHDLEDDAEHVERPANVVLQVWRLQLRLILRLISTFQFHLHTWGPRGGFLVCSFSMIVGRSVM